MGPPLSNPSSFVGRGKTLYIYTPCVWVVGVMIVYIVLIMLTSLMPPILAFTSTRLLRLYFAFGVGLSLYVLSFKGIKLHGFSEARISALLSRWHAVVRMRPTGPVTSFEPWTHCIPPDLHGFYKWAMDTLALLNEFVLKVVRHRQTSRLEACSNLIREDLNLPSVSMASSRVCSSGSLSGLQARRLT